MKKIIFFLLLLNSRGSFGQRPIVSLATMDAWPVIMSEAISNDGKFALYRVSTHPVSGKGGEMFLTVCSTDGKMKWVLPGFRTASFSGDSHWMLALGSGDSLVIMDLWQKVGRRSYDGVRSFKLSGSKKGDAIVAIGLKDQGLMVLNLGKNISQHFERIAGFDFSDSGRYLYLINKNAEAQNEACTLSLLDNSSGKIDTVWRGTDVDEVSFDGESGRIAFLGKDKAKSNGRFSIWVNDGTRRPAMQVVSDSGGIRGDSLEIQHAALKFLPGINALTFDVRSSRKVAKTATADSLVSVWSYQDEYLKGSRETGDRDCLNRNFLFVVFLQDDRVVRLGKAGDGQGGPRICPKSPYPYSFVVNDANLKEGYRLQRERPNIYLINMMDGSRKCIASHIQFARPVFSPSGKYIIWFDIDLHGYFTYNISTGVVKNISKNVPAQLYDAHSDQKGGGYYGISNWIEGDRSVLVNDEFDIWKLDMDGAAKPVNLTNGYGRLHRIEFRNLLYHGYTSAEDPFGINDSVLLCAFDIHSKQNGFFEVYLKGEGPPRKLVMSDDAYYFTGSVQGTDFPYDIKRSGDKNCFLLRKMNARAYPNVYATSDFNSFTKLSNLEPQKAVNWLTVELVHWKTSSGKPGEGMLYKPENFDSTKKYPIIFYFYETLSGGLNAFHDIEPARGPLNIPWFVSRGYLVFCPDIHYSIGDPGSGVYDYVVSAAEMMAKRSWVDSRRMGLQGHSWGADELNYLITRTKLFAAAVSAAGGSDLVSEYGLESFAFGAGPAAVERQQSRMGVSLADCRKCYIDNSPVFWADRVVTPLLLMHNPNDSNVPWEQSLEFYTVLRRFEKKVWLLQYKNAKHVVIGPAAWDYTQKMTDFFDYYLKGAPYPEWMK